MGCGPGEGTPLEGPEANAAHLGSPTAAQKVSRRMRFTEQDLVQLVSENLGPAGGYQCSLAQGLGIWMEESYEMKQESDLDE